MPSPMPKPPSGAAEGQDRVVGVDERDAAPRRRRSSGGRSAGSAGTASRRCTSRAARPPRRPAARARTSGSRPCGSSSRSAGTASRNGSVSSANGTNAGSPAGTGRSATSRRHAAVGDAGRVERREVVVVLDPVPLLHEGPDHRVQDPERSAGSTVRTGPCASCPSAACARRIAARPLPLGPAAGVGRECPRRVSRVPEAMCFSTLRVCGVGGVRTTGCGAPWTERCTVFCARRSGMRGRIL